MVKKKQKLNHDFGDISYTLGIVSIVLAFFQPLAGIVIGVVGLMNSRKQKNEISKKAEKLNTIGVVAGIVLLILLTILSYYLNTKGFDLYSFPS